MRNKGGLRVSLKLYAKNPYTIMKNINLVKNYSRFAEIELGYWDFFGKKYKDKVSPSDLGEYKLKDIMLNEIKMIGDDDDEEL